MCHYITAVLPESADHRALDQIAREHGRQFKPLSNASIEAQLQPDERYFITTVGHCDCGTPLGALFQDTGHRPDWQAQEQRLLNKGWSKAKVARALAQKLLHMYSGSITSRIELIGRETFSSAQITAELLGHMKEDVLYVFRP